MCSERSSKSSKWSSLSEEEKKYIYRKRNAANARKNRKIWKEKEKEMKILLEENDLKIRMLERIADDLTSQLNDHRTLRKIP